MSEADLRRRRLVALQTSYQGRCPVTEPHVPNVNALVQTRSRQTAPVRAPGEAEYPQRMRQHRRSVAVPIPNLDFYRILPAARAWFESDSQRASVRMEAQIGGLCPKLEPLRFPAREQV